VWVHASRNTETHIGESMVLAPTGKKLTIEMHDIFRVAKVNLCRLCGVKEKGCCFSEYSMFFEV